MQLTNQREILVDILQGFYREHNDEELLNRGFLRHLVALLSDQMPWINDLVDSSTVPYVVRAAFEGRIVEQVGKIYPPLIFGRKHILNLPRLNDTIRLALVQISGPKIDANNLRQFSNNKFAFVPSDNELLKLQEKYKNYLEAIEEEDKVKKINFICFPELTFPYSEDFLQYLQLKAGQNDWCIITGSYHHIEQSICENRLFIICPNETVIEQKKFYPLDLPSNPSEYLSHRNKFVFRIEFLDFGSVVVSALICLDNESLGIMGCLDPYNFEIPSSYRIDVLFNPSLHFTRERWHTHLKDLVNSKRIAIAFVNWSHNAGGGTTLYLFRKNNDLDDLVYSEPLDHNSEAVVYADFSVSELRHNKFNATLPYTQPPRP